MRRVFLILIIVVVVIAAAWALAMLPGHVTASIGSITIETSIAVAILAFVLLFGVGWIFLRAVGVILGLPRVGSAWRRRHRLQLGEQAITRVLVALAAGEQREARKEARRARLLLGASPQTLLLTAEASRLSGREDDAEAAFKALTKFDGAEFLGFRGLLRQAIDRRDWGAAEIIAREAEAAHPGTAWLRQQRAELAIHTGNWVEAAELSLLDGRRADYYIAAADAEPDPTRSLRLARQAWKADNSFPPAVIAYASRLRSSGHENRARSTAVEAWKRSPHPDLAEFALANETNPLSRYQSAKRLVTGHSNHLESRLLLGKIALEANLIGEARHQLEAARTEGVNQRRLWLLIAELEESERGDTEDGRISQRDAFHRAAAADPDPTWQCMSCHSDLPKWAAQCSSCGAIGTVRWHVSSPNQIVSLPVIA